jgi:hypothetical protein
MSRNSFLLAICVFAVLVLGAVTIATTNTALPAPIVQIPAADPVDTTFRSPTPPPFQFSLVNTKVEMAWTTAPVDDQYWDADGKHYVHIKGTWYGDYYVEAHRVDGQAVVGQFGVFDSLHSVERYVYDTSHTGYFAFRDPSSSLFNSGIIRWAAWPVGQIATADNLEYQVFDGRRLIWYSQDQMTDIVNNDSVRGQIGINTAGQAEAWRTWARGAAESNVVKLGLSLEPYLDQPR